MVFEYERKKEERVVDGGGRGWLKNKEAQNSVSGISPGDRMTELQGPH